MIVSKHIDNKMIPHETLGLCFIHLIRNHETCQTAKDNKMKTLAPSLSKEKKKVFFSFFCEKSSGGAGSIIVQENKLCQPSTLIHHQVNAIPTFLFFILIFRLD
jgi:hypothetical protein